jgi:hypothetical protein
VSFSTAELLYGGCAYCDRSTQFDSFLRFFESNQTMLTLSGCFRVKSGCRWIPRLPAQLDLLLLLLCLSPGWHVLVCGKQSITLLRKRLAMRGVAAGCTWTCNADVTETYDRRRAFWPRGSARAELAKHGCRSEMARSCTEYSNVTYMHVFSALQASLLTRSLHQASTWCIHGDYVCVGRAWVKLWVLRMDHI